MDTIKTVSLIGLGAIGAAYGSKLHDLLGNDFTVVAKEERIARYKQGVHINGETYHFHCQTPETDTEPRDLVIFAVKNAQLKQAIHEARHHIGPNTIILSLLNGISSEEEIYSATQSEHILYSMCVAIDALRENNDIRFSSLGRICFGEKNQQDSPDVRAVAKLFETAGITYEIPENIWRTIWSKFMLNVGVNQVSAVLGASYDYFQNIPELYDWMEEAMNEVVQISQKVGVNLTTEDIESYRPILKALSPNGETSMLQDIHAKRKTEVEYFAGKVCELGEKHHVPTPINDQLARIIPIIEKMNDFDLQRNDS